MLPVLLSLLGSSAAGAGVLGAAASPLLMGAAGSAAGTLLEGGDLEEGMMAGLGSYLTGGLMGSIAGGLGGAAGDTAAQQVAQGLPNPAAAGAQAAAPAQGGLFQGVFNPPKMPPPTPDMGMVEKFTRGPLSAQGMGAALGSGLLLPPEAPGGGKKGGDHVRVERPQWYPEYREPRPGHRGGLDPEHRFFKKGRGYRPSGFAETIYMHGGGLVDSLPQQGVSSGPTLGGGKGRPPMSVGQGTSYPPSPLSQKGGVARSGAPSANPPMSVNTPMVAPAPVRPEVSEYGSQWVDPQALRDAAPRGSSTQVSVNTPMTAPPTAMQTPAQVSVNTPMTAPPTAMQAPAYAGMSAKGNNPLTMNQMAPGTMFMAAGSEGPIPGPAPGAGLEAAMQGPPMAPPPQAMPPQMPPGGMEGPAAPRPGSPKDAVRVLTDKELVSAATMAIKGMLNDQEAAMVLGEFMSRFGQEKLATLADDVVEGRAETFRDEHGKISGPGGPKDDMVPAEVAGANQDVLLSPGEVVTPAEEVAALGDGDNDKGAKKLASITKKALKDKVA